MGPYFVTKDEIVNPLDLQISCWVNGERRQHENTSRMIFSIPAIIAFYSRMTLNAGDIFMTGSPAGVAIGMPDPERNLLKPGDLVEIEITGLGKLSNTIAA